MSFIHILFVNWTYQFVVQVFRLWLSASLKRSAEMSVEIFIWILYSSGVKLIIRIIEISSDIETIQRQQMNNSIRNHTLSVDCFHDLSYFPSYGVCNVNSMNKSSDWKWILIDSNELFKPSGRSVVWSIFPLFWNHLLCCIFASSTAGDFNMYITINSLWLLCLPFVSFHGDCFF